MKKILKVLLAIILINIFFFKTIGWSSGVDQNPKKCNFFTSENLDLKSYRYPSNLEIIIPNSKKWISRILKALETSGMKESRINKNLKKYQTAIIKKISNDGLICFYKGKVRIHGSTIDHIDVKNLKPSLRVKLNNHINNKYNFALINKKAASFDNEIFASTLFEELNFLSPLTYKVKVKINENIEDDYLFVEMPTMEMSKDNKRNNGIFLSSNRNNFIKHKTAYKYRRSVVLGRIKNSQGIAENNNNVLFYALDKINYIYLNSLGIGNGRDCCENNLILKKNKIEKNYFNGTYNLKFSNLDDLEEIKNISIFNLLMNTINAQHGLALEDRMFFYDPTFDRIEPVYRDGDTDIIDENNFVKEPIQLFGYEKKYINNAKSLINKINIEKFKKKLILKGLNLRTTKIKEILNRIDNNLTEINNTDLLENYLPKNTKNYFKKHFDKNLKFMLAFDGIDNNFEICDVELANCTYKRLNFNQSSSLIGDKFIKLKNFDKEILYVRISKIDYLNNSKPKKRGLKKFNNIKIEKNLSLFFNSDINSINIDHKNKIINLNQNRASDRFIFVGTNEINWNLKFTGVPNVKGEYFKRDENMIGGCVTFINSRIKNISVDIKKNSCGKGLEVLLSEGVFDKINISSSKLDAFDAEFSNLKINNIIVNKADGGECIGVKRGKYIIINSQLKDCGDKAVSAGEHTTLILNDIKIVNSIMGIVAKDSAKITVYKYLNKNSKGCMHAYRGKNIYNGAVINIKKDEFNCGKSKIEFDKFSKIEYFNE